MPLRHQSAIKKNKQDLRKRVRNTRNRTMTVSSIKTFLKTIEGKDKDAAAKQLKATISSISKFGKTVFHKKTLSRKISRLTKRYNAAFAAK